MKTPDEQRRDALLAYIGRFGRGAIKELAAKSNVSNQTIYRARDGGEVRENSWNNIIDAINELKKEQPSRVAEAPEQYTLEREYPINQPEVLKEIDKLLVQMLKAVRKSDTCTNAQLGVVRGGVDYLKDVLVPEAQELINAGNQNKPKPHNEQ